MAQPLQCVPEESLITGWDFSTGSVKCIAFNPDGKPVAEVRMDTDLWHEFDPAKPAMKDRRGRELCFDTGIAELNVAQLEGQAASSTRVLAQRLKKKGRLHHWIAGGISATHHTSARIDGDRMQVRRAICWNDQTLAKYHAEGLARLGGQAVVEQLIGWPVADRYTLSHLVKDEKCLDEKGWKRTKRIAQHGVLAAGFLTDNFDRISISAAASTGIMNLKHDRWQYEMLEALSDLRNRDYVKKQLPEIQKQSHVPIGPLRQSLCTEAGIDPQNAPLIFPTSDDQQAGLVGGGAVDPGQMAIILGNSAVVNSSSDGFPENSKLDVMKLNWGKYLWMRCYTNGAQFLDTVFGKNADWKQLESAGRQCPPGAKGHTVSPFVKSEPSLGVAEPRYGWHPKLPGSAGVRFRACLEALAYLVALGVRAHEEAGQRIERITVSGGIAKSRLMCDILASVLNRPLRRLKSNEGPALGAAVTALSAYETYCRVQQGIRPHYSVGDAVDQMVKFGGVIKPKKEWIPIYEQGLREFEKGL